jgi:hypothetical protein
VEFVDKNVVTSNRAFSIFEPSAFIFGILSSTMHSVWVNAVAGRLESRINYSSTICYNNFPLPPVTPDIKQLIEIRSMNVIDTRELYPDKTLAEMYDPNKMPYDLHQAHDGLDDVIDSLYRKKPFDNDEERLAHLFDLYKQMTAIKGKTK